jgi:threonine dehydrogenase-like Zn-dependent dehydrogenase
MGAEMCGIKRGDTIAVWGCGPVGQFAIRSAFLLGAGRVIAIDTVPERRRMAEAGGAETLDSMDPDVFERLRDMTGGIGPDSCIDAVGLEAHGPHVDYYYDKAKTATFMATDRVSALRQAIHSCRKGGTVSVPGVYGGFLDKVPFGAIVNKGLTIKSGQTHVQKYLPALLRHIEAGNIDPAFVVTHRVSLDDAPEMYKTFRDKKDGCIKVVMKPH